MAWKCRLIETDTQPKEIGDMWFGEAVPIKSEPGRYWCVQTGRLSEQYIRERMTLRPPLLVMMPNLEVFCVDAAVSGEWRGWVVSGEAPRITVSPSINLVGRYHGFLRDGVISDDVEGRKFGE
jgi:hypothetical protein